MSETPIEAPVEAPVKVPVSEMSNDIILEIVERFRNSPVSQDAIDEFCNRRHVEPITIGELDDHIYQVKNDERMAKVYPLILAEIAKITYAGEYMSKNQLAKRHVELDAIEDNIVKILTDNELPYRLIESNMRELTGIVNKMIENSKTRLSNLCVGVMLKVTEKHFGNKEFTAKDAQDYYETIKNEV